MARLWFIHGVGTLSSVVEPSFVDKTSFNVLLSEEASAAYTDIAEPIVAIAIDNASVVAKIFFFIKKSSFYVHYFIKFLLLSLSQSF